MTHDEVALLELRSMRSAWSALETRWELAPRERRALLPGGGVEDDAPPRDTETRMRILIEIGHRISLPECTLDEWLHTATATLGYLTPLEVMSGSLAHLRGLRRLVEQGFAS